MTDNDHHSKKRSEHSEQRRQEGRRVAPAFNDAQKAKQSEVFIQLDGRYVVRGKKGREHIFETNGELVTSIDRSQKAHLLKIRKGERQPITDNQFELFKRLFL
jgi:hypothetical protein